MCNHAGSYLIFISRSSRVTTEVGLGPACSGFSLGRVKNGKNIVCAHAYTNVSCLNFVIAFCLLETNASICMCVCVYAIRMHGGVSSHVSICAASHFTLSHTNFHASWVYVCVCVKVRKEKMAAEEEETVRWTKGSSDSFLMSPECDRRIEGHATQIKALI